MQQKHMAIGGDEGIKNVKDLKVYIAAFELAKEVFELTLDFPKEERYSLTDQIRRSSRSVAINIREGFAKRRYKNVFIRHLNDSVGSSEETRGWLNFSARCGYIAQETHRGWIRTTTKSMPCYIA